jgi:hypothetical protein
VPCSFLEGWITWVSQSNINLSNEEILHQVSLPEILIPSDNWHGGVGHVLGV